MAEGGFHHDVPEFLLRRFSHSSRDGLKVFALSKSSKGISEIAIKRASGSIGGNVLHYVEGDHETSSNFLEDFFSNIENRSAPITRMIGRERGKKCLSGEERHTIMAFIAMQYVRTPGFYQKRSFNLELNIGDLELKDHGVDSASLDDMLHYLKKSGQIGEVFGISNALAKRELTAVLSGANREFVLGDNPVVISRPTDQHYPINLRVFYEISNPEAVIYLPISRAVALCLEPITGDLRSERSVNIRYRLLDGKDVSEINKLQFSTAVDNVYGKTIGELVRLQ